LSRDKTGSRRMNALRIFVGLMLALMLFAPGAGAQTQPTEGKAVDAKPSLEVYQTFYLTNVLQQNDLSDIQTDLRNVLPKARIYGLPSQNAISMRATPEDIQLAQKIIADLDRPRKVYRLTYTITETEDGKRLGAQQFSLIATSGVKTELKQGKREPAFVGENDAKTTNQNPQAEYVGAKVQYLDVGVAIEATVEGSSEGLSLRTKIVQSNLAGEKSGVGPQDPVIRQTVLEESSNLLLGKPLLLGSLDLPGGTRKQKIEVVAELVQ